MAKKFDLAELMGGKTAPVMSDSDTVVQLPVEELHGNEGNFYAVDDVKDLCDSIAVSGVLQPILARPRVEGGYTIIAGHRRTKAVRQLREEWKGKGENPYDTVPAILRPAPATKAEELLEDLALITTNSAARKLTDPELSQQAEKLADILYGLKQEGYEFPGRMRKVVAEALGVSETKLARQKTIREKLSPAWLERWKAGKCPEYAAEALARLAPEVQDAMLFMKSPEPSRIDALAAYYRKCHTVHHCPYTEQPCDWTEHFWAVGSRESNSYDRCGGYSSIQCCKGCRKALKCKECCPTALKKAKEAKKREDKEREKERAERQREAEARIARAAALWARFQALREAAGLSREDLAKKLRKVVGTSASTLAGFEERDPDKLYSWQSDQAPEAYLSFKGVYLAAQLFGCPVEALTDVEWAAPESRAGLEAADGREADARILPQSPAATAPSRREPDRCGGTVDEGRETVNGLFWRPYPKIVPPAGTRALVVQKQGAYERLVFEAKLAKFDGNAWTWVSEVIPDVEAERVEWWLPEPKFPDPPEEEDDVEDPDE